MYISSFSQSFSGNYSLQRCLIILRENPFNNYYNLKFVFHIIFFFFFCTHPIMPNPLNSLKKYPHSFPFLTRRRVCRFALTFLSFLIISRVHHSGISARSPAVSRRVSWLRPRSPSPERECWCEAWMWRRWHVDSSNESLVTCHFLPLPPR